MTATIQLSMLTAILDRHEHRLRTRLAAIPTHDASPFARVPGTHNGRWTVVRTDPDPAAPRRAGGLPAPMLMCSAVIDDPPEVWLPRLLDVLGDEADGIWRHCPGWPARSDSRVEYLLARRVPSMLPFATWDHPATTILDALRTHDALRSFAVETQGADSLELLAAYRKRFGP